MPEYRDVTTLRQEMQGWRGRGVQDPFTPGEVLWRLDACPPAPGHADLLSALMRLVDEHNLTGPGVAELRRRVAAALNETENRS